MATADQKTLAPGPASSGGLYTIKIVKESAQTGNFSALTASPIFVAPFACRVASVNLTALTFPTTSDRTATCTVKKVSGTTAATTICSTEAAFAATAGGSGVKSTLTGGTGITSAVLKTDGTATLAAGDMLTVDTAFAGSNGTIGTGCTVTVEIVPLYTLPS